MTEALTVPAEQGGLTEYQQYQPLTAKAIREQVNLIQSVMREVMKENEHYGVIPGTKKPTLYKSGAEKLCLTFRLAPRYEVSQVGSDGHLSVLSTCTLYHVVSGQRLGSGMGSCSTRETKYAYRQTARKCPACGSGAIIKGKPEYGGGWVCLKSKDGCGKKYAIDAAAIADQTIGRVPNEDIPDQFNTVLKMSNKRSLIAAVLNVTAASDIFAQDLEDATPEGTDPPANQPMPTRSSAPKEVDVPFNAPEQPKEEPNKPEQPQGDWKSMKAKFNGYCKKCNGPIDQGDEIIYNAGERELRHPECADSA